MLLNRRQQIKRLQGMDNLSDRQERRLDTLQKRRQENVPTQRQMEMQQQRPTQPMQRPMQPQQTPGIMPYSNGNMEQMIARSPSVVPIGQQMSEERFQELFPSVNMPQAQQGMPRPHVESQPYFGPGPSMGAYSNMGWQSSGMMPQGMPQNHPGNFRAQDRMAASAEAQPRSEHLRVNYANQPGAMMPQPWGGRARGIVGTKPPQV